jgi:hypothetical protein
MMPQPANTLRRSHRSSAARCLTCAGSSVWPVTSSIFSLAQKYPRLNTISATLACVGVPDFSNVTRAGAHGSDLGA